MRAAAMGALCVVVVACGSSSSATASPPVASSSPAVASSGRTEPTITPPSIVVTPTASTLPAFACADAAGGVNVSANVNAVRLGQDNGYDRFVLQFDSPTVIPAFTAKRQTSPNFTADASGQPLTLDGSYGVRVRVSPANNHDGYTGPVDFKHPDFAVLKEARLIGDFEGVVSWGLGLSRAACMRAFTLTDPARLVIDFTTS